MTRITAIIPTFNEEEHVAQAIKSVRWADEILVVDSLSTDKTVSLAKEHGAKVVEREYAYSASQKNWAIPQAEHEWIILLDADERVTEKLAKEIREELESPEHDAYWIGRTNHFQGKLVRWGDWKRDAVIRLFKRDTCRYEDLHVHAEIQTTGSIGRLKHRLIHFTYKGMDHYMKKLDRYTNWGAHDRFNKGVRLNAFHLVLKPVWSFVRSYLLRLGFLDGTVGFTVARLAAFTAYTRTQKVMKLQRGEHVPKN